MIKGRRIVLLVALLASLGVGQGRTDYANFETPQVKPITVARLAGHDYLLVCNTPDNRVEIYDTDESLPPSARLLARVRVGLEPNSVVWSQALGRFFTTNWLSDSVSVVALSAPAGPSSLSAVVEVERNVGDEPMHCSPSGNHQILLVSFKTESAVGAFDPLTLAPIPPDSAHPAPTDRIPLLDTSTNPDRAIKQPRTVLHHAGRYFVLGTRGGGSFQNQKLAFDFGLYARDLSSGQVTGLGGLGTTNFNMAFAPGGDLYVVGGKALIDLPGGAAVAAAPTGFFQSSLYLVQGAGTPQAAVLRRNLNEERNAAGQAVPVTPSLALTMPTDVVVMNPTLGQPGLPVPGGLGNLNGLAPKLFLACMGTDKVAAVIPSPANDPLAWNIVRIAIPTAPGSTNPVAGPRGLALKAANLNQANDPGPRLYCMNRLDNSVTVIDPLANSVITTFSLNHDPTPQYIRAGRQWLYSASFSNTHFVSCAVCHVDGRTDGLAWNLGDPNGSQVVSFPLLFIDGPGKASIPDVVNLLVNGYDTNKGLMVTQSFQGLVNWEVPPISRKFVTNGPYHWRGCKKQFTDFNEAFVNLFGLPDISGNPNVQMGIPAQDMDAFEEYVDSIHYPPNPREPETRRYSGSLGSPNSLNDGSGGLLGLKAFHEGPLSNANGRSCVQCHALPEGSNNRFTAFLGGGGTGRQPLETAALRGLFQKEAILNEDPNMPAGNGVTGSFGLEHHGASFSLVHFNQKFFANQFPGPGQLQGLNQFSVEFDWGTAPVVGRNQLVNTGNAGNAQVLSRIAAFELQVQEANAGLAVRGTVAGNELGWWFDPILNAYRSEPGGGTQSLSAILQMLGGPADLLVFVATPLGSERRVAAPSGQATPLLGPAASNLRLLPMVPDTAYSDVPLFTKNWVPGSGPDSFIWNHGSLPTPLFLKSIRLLQAGLINDAGGAFGLTMLRHDAPRRFRIAGDNIRQGAVLHLFVPFDNTAPVPNPTGPLNQMVTRELVMPLHPTNLVDGGQPVWETVVELEPLAYYVMMCGGPFAPGVPAALSDILDQIQENPTGLFNPLTYNWHFVRVENPGGQVTDGGWMQLSIN